jgi:hypothetical protein
VTKHNHFVFFTLILLAAGLFAAQFLVQQTQNLSKDARTESINPPQGVPPVIYEMYGTANQNFGDQSGAVGSWFAPGWSEIEPQDNQFNWGPIDSYLNSFAGKTTTTKNGQKIPVPQGIGINLLVEACGGTDSSPSPEKCTGLQVPKWLLDKTGFNISRSEPQPNCGTAYFPKWNDPVFQEQYTELVKEFGKRYDKDPRIAWIAINSGPYGEAISTMYNGRRKPDGSACPPFNTSQGFGNWLIGSSPNSLSQQGLIKIYRSAFPTKALIIINTGADYRKTLAEQALEVSPPVGIKMHSWQPDLPQQFSDSSQVNVIKWYQDTCQQKGLSGCITGLEHFYANNRPQTYWAMLFLITHHLTLADIPKAHIEALKNLDNCDLYKENGQPVGDCYPMWQLVENHLGRDVYSAPSVLTVLRDTVHTDASYANTAWDTRGEFGNWSRYLTLITNTKDSSEYPSVHCQSLKAPYNKVNTDRIFGCWDGMDRIVARQTTAQKPYMDFFIDSRWPAKQSTGFKLEIIYIDNGTDRFNLSYKDSSNQTQTVTVQKNNTSRFVRHLFNLPSMAAKFSLSGTSNFRLDDNGDGSEQIHLVHLIPQNWSAPKWDFQNSSSAGNPTSAPQPTAIPESLPECDQCDQTTPCAYRCQQNGIKKVCRKVGNGAYAFYDAGLLQTQCAVNHPQPNIFCNSDDGSGTTTYQCCYGEDVNLFVPNNYWAYRTSGCQNPAATPTSRPLPGRICNQACNTQTAPCQNGLQCYLVDTGKGYKRSACRNPNCPQLNLDQASCDCPAGSSCSYASKGDFNCDNLINTKDQQIFEGYLADPNLPH